MDSLPEHILLYIILYLTPKEVFLTAKTVSKVFRQITENNHFLNILTKTTFRLSLPNILSNKTCYNMLRHLFKRSSLKTLINLTPVSTDGGADEDEGLLWFGNAFQLDESFWCSIVNLKNVNASAVLAETQSKPGFCANLEVIKLVQTWIDQTGRIESTEENLASLVFNQVVSSFFKGIFLSPDTAFDIKQVIQTGFTRLRPFPQGYSTLRRFRNDIAVCDMKFDRLAADCSEKIALIKYIEVSRKGYCTCPVKTLMVFVSFTYVDILDDSLKIYNDIKDYQNLLDLNQNFKDLPRCTQKYLRFGNEYCEFEPCSQVLKPVLWLNFKTDDRVNEVRVELASPVTAKYFYVKLIQAEDRREERKWNHPEMNIDINYILPRGKVICIDN